jgi:membrane-bound lytic murein transglycosylase D
MNPCFKSLVAIAVAGAFAFPAAAADRFVHVTGVPSAIEARADKGINPEIERLLDRPADLWERIRLGFAMPDLDHKLVAQQEAFYSSRPELLQAVVVRARRYLHFIVDELERRGMPTELALLPIVESGYNPMALSSAQASGLWQFIPSTGIRYKLEQNAHYDGRRDVIASTSAALDYLQFLHGYNHKDWHRALASYNWGEEAVARAVERNRARGLPGDFSSLTVPDETRSYVPRLMALRNIVRNPAAYGVNLAEVPNEPVFTVVPIERDLEVRAAASLAGMAVDEFVSLNPAFNQGLIPAASRVGLVIPLDRTEVFKANFERYLQAAAARGRGRAIR